MRNYRNGAGGQLQGVILERKQKMFVFRGEQSYQFQGDISERGEEENRWDWQEEVADFSVRDEEQVFGCDNKDFDVEKGETV